jgi:uncharacterized protein YbcI
VLEDPFTTAERTLIEADRQDLVRQLRLEFQELNDPILAAAVEALTGCKVLACHSQVVFDPDMVFQVFVLEAPGIGTVSMLAA